ncbi:MAG: BTAD domain-containing putative transcriptional regulator [Burkholderiales bacterium]
MAKVYPRRRLFKRLDQACKRPVVWISAPAGAGKTTLVTSYLKDRGLRCVWYQLDAGDNDPASFFYYLGLAARQAAPRRRRPMPLLTPEYLQNLPVFTRNFFRELFARLNTPAALVLDNFQELPEGAPLQEALAQGLREAHAGVTVLVVSRADPPAPFASLRATDALALVEWEELRLNEAESKGVARLRQADLSATALRAFIEQSQGWMAGLVLLIEQWRASPHPRVLKDMRGHAMLFDYFATELFERTEPALREFLLKTAFLPKIAASAAAELSGNPRAEEILSDLARRNYFTVRHAGPDGDTYEYHPLFRQFLLEHAQATFPSAQIDALRMHAAALLEAAGDIEAAVQLWTDAGAWEEMIVTALAAAPALLTQGRWKTLVEWFERLPAPMRDANPGVAYWLGIALMPFDPPRARAALSFAYHEFKKAGAVEARWRAWCGVVDSFVFEWRDFHPLDEWIAEIERDLVSVPVALDAEVASGMFMALMNGHPQHPDMGRWAQRAWDLAIGGTDPVLRIKTGPHLLLYYTWWIGDLPKAELLLNALRPYAEDASAPPLVQITLCAMVGAYCWMNAENSACIATVERGLGLADTTGVHVWDMLLCTHGTFATLTSGQIEPAQVYVRRMAALQDPARAMDSALYYYLSGYLYYSQGDRTRALEHTKTAVDMAEAAGAVYQTGILLNEYGRMLYYAGDERGAGAAIERALATSQEIRSSSMEYLCYLAQAEIALRRGEKEACRTALTQCLQIGRQHGYRNHTWWDAELMAQLYARALEHDIEVPYVQELIRCRALSPPRDSQAVEQWPYPVKLYTLGRIDVVLDGKPLRFKGKAQRRPLELLMALISLGGRAVSVSHLTDTLWPGTEADAAHAACKSTLYRLRRLLGDDAALLLGDNQLSLNPDKVWVDAWVFERAVVRAETEKTSEADAECALALYHGAFLGGAAAPWTIPAREKLRAKFLRVLTSASRRHMQDGRHEAALRLLDRGLATEPLAEALYCDAMRCHAALGRRAEVLLAYQRCHKLLASQLGIDPSPTTQALYRAARDNRPLPP